MKLRHLTLEDLRGRRWRGYVRESTERQAEQWSPDRQRADLRRAADELGLVAVEPLFYERTGTGESASTELDRALADAQAGQYDALLVLATSRFARNRAEAVRQKARFAKAGVPIYFVQDRILSGTRHTRLLEGVREVMDEEENEQRRFWIAGGLRERQLSGRWIGRIPHGLQKRLANFEDGTRGWDGTLEAHPDHAPVIREIFESAARGASIRSIAFRLNLSGRQSASGGPWSGQAIRLILTNPTYKGELVRYRRSSSEHYYAEDDAHDGRREIGRSVPPIVDPGLWEAGQAAVGESRRAVRVRAYPLSGVVRCVCGYKMHGTTNGTTRYYRCPGKAWGVCTAPTVNADRAERDFEEWVSAIHLPPDWRERLAGLRVKAVVSDEAERRRALDERLSRIKDLYAWGHMEKDTYLAEAEQLRGEMTMMAMPDMASATSAADMLATLPRLWANLPAERRGELARRLLDSAVADQGNVVDWRPRPVVGALLEMSLSRSVVAARVWTCTRDATGYSIRRSA